MQVRKGKPPGSSRLARTGVELSREARVRFEPRAEPLRPAEVGLLGLAMTAFYVGGMYLNDYFDREIDARERPGRPINAGEITAGAVSLIGFGLLALGILLSIGVSSEHRCWVDCY